MSATTTPAGLLPHHWAELQASAIAADVAALNVASFGPGSGRHWETERAELVAHARHRIQTERMAGNGHPQAQPGHLSEALAGLDRRYRNLQAGGWRTLSDTLPGLPGFDQWKPDQPREKGKRDPRTGEWKPDLGADGRPAPLRYEAPPQAPDGGGLLLPHVPDRCWRLICDREGLPFPDAPDRADGFWAWALATPGLRVVICEGWKKSLAAVSAGWAALALPGVQMGRRTTPQGGERLIAALRALSHQHKRSRCTITRTGRPWLIAYDAESRPATAAKVAAAAGALARALRALGGRVEIARLPLLPGTTKTGLDDLLAAAGPEALERALSDTGPRGVLPHLSAADRIAPAGGWLGETCPLPTPEAAPLVILQASMGCGKTEAIAQALAPLAAQGVPILMPFHRQALGQAAAERVGVHWCPAPGSDERLQGLAGCWDSWCPDSGLQISGHGWSGGVFIADEWAQACEHLLLSDGTALAQRRASVLRTTAEQLPRMRQTIAADAQMPDWAVTLLERLSGRRAHVIRSEHQPMAGRPLHAPQGFADAQAAADAFRVKWAELIDAGRPFLCWSSAQQARMRNAAQTLAAYHRQRRPADLVDVCDSTTAELAAELAADPDGFAFRRTAEAEAQGGTWALYCSPAISSGISFSSWKPAAVIAYAGGRVAPEHVAQALARVRCPEVPAYVFAPDRCPGAALRVGSGATDPAQLIADLRAVADPLLGQLAAADDEGAWLEAWGQLGAIRNKQRHSYAATIAALLVREGWALQAPEAERPDAEAEAQTIAEALGNIASAAQTAEDLAMLSAEPIEPEQARTLERRRKLEPAERAALGRYRLLQRWALLEEPPELALGSAPHGRITNPGALLLEADREGLRERLRLGWILTTPEALELIGPHDQAAVAALDRTGRPFEPDRLRVALAPRIAALQALRLPQLLERFAAGETIAADDPAVIALHTNATAHAGQLAAAVGISPGAYASGTLRALLQAVGWKLERAGRIHTRKKSRGVLTYRAQPEALPQLVNPQALAAAWLAELQAMANRTGAFFPPTEKPYRAKKCATPHPRSAPPPVPPPAPLGLPPGPSHQLALSWPSGPRSRQDRAPCPA